MAGNRHSQYLYSNKRVILKSFWFLIKSHKYYSSNIDDSKITCIGPQKDFNGVHSSQQCTDQNIFIGDTV